MGIEKHYADDWAKAKSRDLVRGLIERTLLTFRKPEDLSVLCFPGIDGAEVIQVYDSLDIPRGNITGLERDPEIAVRARCLLIGSDSIEKRIMKSFEVQESRGDLFEPIGRSEIEEVTVYDVVNKNQYLRFERAVYQLCPVSTRKFNLKSRKSGRTWKEEECTWKFHPGATSDYRAQLKELEG